MNREIKFRAWDNTTCLMVDNYAHTDDYGELHSAHFHGTSYTLTSRPNLELMQYTGIKDKNGVEIYEGDIYKPVKGKYIVVFFEGAFCGHRIDKKPEESMPIGWSTDEQDSDELSPDYFYSEIEVIGNIYQNPELLK